MVCIFFSLGLFVFFTNSFTLNRVEKAARVAPIRQFLTRRPILKSCRPTKRQK